MRRVISAIVAAAFTASLGMIACAAPGPLTQDALAHITSIGVINATGNQMKLTGIGTTVFTNTGGNMSITDWAIGDNLVKQASEVVGPRIRVGLAEVDITQFEKAKGGFMNSIESQLAKIVKAGPNSNWDVYLLLKTAEGADQYLGSMEGFGLRHRQSFGTRSDIAYLYLEFYLIDAKNGAILAEAPLGTWWTTDGTSWPNEAITAESQKAALKKEFAYLLTEGPPNKLRNMGLSRPDKPTAAQ